jgi:acetylornithine deacetylase/succinyl-diaminopimelate desuccinylase-like protein
MEWMVNQHPDLVECEYAINEGGGYGFDFGGQRFYLCQTGEKGVCWMKFSVRGTAGHGSMPKGDNAVAKLCSALARLSQAHLPQHRTATVDQLVRTLAAAQPFPASLLTTLVLNPILEPHILARVEAKSEIGAALRATLHNTVSPTVLRAGTKTNVIPGEATAEVDGRLIPGQTYDDLMREMRPYIGDEIQVEFLQRSLPVESTLPARCLSCSRRCWGSTKAVAEWCRSSSQGEPMGASWRNKGSKCMASCPPGQSRAGAPSIRPTPAMSAYR